LLAIAFVSAPASGVAHAQDSGVQVIEVTAKKYEFSPIHVKAGKVQLKVTATDRDHGFAIDAVAEGAKKDSPPGLIVDSPEKCWKLPKGETITINLTAQIAGTYQIKCCAHCGLGHGGMKGTIVVDNPR
jgi:heme/copper-type cytochrome/quinol oxidase subunit 2